MALISGSTVAPTAAAAGGETVWARAMRSKRLRVLRAPLLVVISLVIFFGAWQILSYYLLNPYLIPPPSRVFTTAVPMIKSGEIFRDIGISLVRVLIGFSLGSLAAIVMGVIMGRIRVINELLDPIIEVLRYLSPTAMIPIAVIWFGIGEQSKYFLIFWGTFFFVLINTVAGVIRTPVARQRAAQCLGANQLEIVPAPHADRRGGPFANAVDREDGGVPGDGRSVRERLDLPLRRVALDLAPTVRPTEVLLVLRLKAGAADEVSEEVPLLAQRLNFMSESERPGPR